MQVTRNELQYNCYIKRNKLKVIVTYSIKNIACNMSLFSFYNSHYPIIISNIVITTMTTFYCKVKISNNFYKSGFIILHHSYTNLYLLLCFLCFMCVKKTFFKIENIILLERHRQRV